MKRKHPQYQQQPPKRARRATLTDDRGEWVEQTTERRSPREGENESQGLYGSHSSHRERTNSVEEPFAMDLIVQNASQLERNLLLETSIFEHAQQSPRSPFHQSAGSPNSSYHSSPPEFNIASGISDSMLLNGLTRLQGPSLSSDQIQYGCDLFFTHISPFVPIIHQPTFDTSEAPTGLLLSMLSLGYQYGEDPDCGHSEGSGVVLSTQCFHQARVRMASEEAGATEFSPDLAIVQSYLLLQICAMMYLCGTDSGHGRKMHSSMISHARAKGMMQPETATPSAASDLDSLWRAFVKAESHKRTLFAVHQIDTLWYQFLSIPRCISHLEIKHELPCPESQWLAVSSAEWAHRRLIANDSAGPVQYADAVRRFLSTDADLTSLPSFDPYGAINVAQFLISSAREITGWSTMTGMLSMERFECLKTSLTTLLPYIDPAMDTSGSVHTTLCMATWQTAMLELQLWSPSHTGGIVGGTLDAMLHQLTALAPTYDLLCDFDTAKAIEPHVHWFLRYLNDTLIPDAEAPWVTLYAYKAFLNAWQLVRAGISGAMQIVGVADGDLDGATAWARMVFGRRRHWKLGRIIISCLHELGSDSAN